jgi:SAM-dependent methyltransferase
MGHIPSHRWWSWIFEEAGLSKPRLDWVHTGWGMMSKDPKHRRCPAYYNFGFVIAPRIFVDRMGETFADELDAVDRVVENWAKSQIANTLAIARHDIPCGALSINDNFPLHVPEDAIRALNPDPDGKDSSEDIRIFHCLGDGEVNRSHFATRERVEEVLNRSEMSPAGRVLQQRLRRVCERIAEGGNELSHLTIPEYLHRNATDVVAEGYQHTGRILIDLATRRCGLENLDSTDVLDVGCGVRFTLTIINQRVAIKSYTGIDVDIEVISFLNEKVAAFDNRFRFGHLDAHNQMYNPSGDDLSRIGRLPVDKSFDVVWAFSLFTHLAPHDSHAMLHILRKYIRQDGKLFFSAFIDDDLDGNGMSGFVDRVAGSPLLEACYGRKYMESLIENAGWRVVSFYDKDPSRSIMHSFLCSPGQRNGSE